MRVLCAGECMVEFLRQDDGLWRQGFAGDTLNVAWAVRALLPDDHAVDYLTRTGDDALSRRMVAMLAQAGIGTGAIGRDPKRTLGLYTIETDDSGERHFTYWRSASAARALAPDPENLTRQFWRSDLVYLSGITLAILPPEDRENIIAGLGSRGQRLFRVAFDPNVRTRLWESLDAARAAITAVAAQSDIVLPTHEDEAMLFGDTDAAATAARYGALGAPEIVVKDGARPTLLCAGARTAALPVTPATRVIDTTGTGESFNGTYLAARLSERTPEEAVRAAQAVSAMVVGVRGALAPMDAIRAAARI